MSLGSESKSDRRIQRCFNTAQNSYYLLFTGDKECIEYRLCKYSIIFTFQISKNSVAPHNNTVLWWTVYVLWWRFLDDFIVHLENLVILLSHRKCFLCLKSKWAIPSIEIGDRVTQGKIQKRVRIWNSVRWHDGYSLAMLFVKLHFG